MCQVYNSQISQLPWHRLGILDVAVPILHWRNLNEAGFLGIEPGMQAIHPKAATATSNNLVLKIMISLTKLSQMCWGSKS